VVSAKHRPEHRLAGDDVLPVADLHDQVEVLEDTVALRLDRDGGVVDVPHLARDDGIHRRSSRRGDVDAVVEEERPRPLQPVGEHRVEEPGARVPEVRPDRMLLVEGLEWPRVGRGRGARAQGQTTDQEEDSEAHGSYYGDSPATVRRRSCRWPGA